MSYISAKLDRKTNKVLVWHSENHVTTCKRYPGIYEFYIADKDGEYVSVFNEKLKKYSFDSYYEFEEAKKFLIDEKRIKLYESDIDIEFKVLSKLYYKQPAPKLNITMYDIEVDYNPLIGFSSPLNPYAPVNAISLHHYWLGESYVLAVPPPGFDMNDFDESLRDLSKVEFFKNERSLLLRFLDLIEDTTLITGWNSNGFDDPYICKRINQILGPRALKRMSFPDAPIPRFRETLVRNRTQCFVDIYGRVSVDYLEIFKKYEFKERPSYKLEAIADEFLPHLPKLSYTGTLASLYHNDFNHFIRYNVRDTEILKGFEDKLGYMALANEMCHSSCGLFTHIHGTVKLVDYAIINYCHNDLNVKVPDRWDTADGSIQGAYVLLPQQGMHEHIGSIDISSLYPSAIIAINISPETYIGQFENNINDWETLYARREEELTLFLADGSTISKTTSEWVGYMLNKKWAVSGYGTVYDQTNPGIIPTILSNWYVERKEFQKLKLQYHDEASANPTQYDGLIEKSNYYDRLQFVTKIRLNSTYGALTNYNFRFFKLEAGESVTGTGRMILRHQCRKVSELLGGPYNTNFPLYETVKECIEHGCSPDLALHGPVFKGEFPSESIVYGDSVAHDSKIYTNIGLCNICNLFNETEIIINNKEYYHPSNLQVLTYDEVLQDSCYKSVKYVMRHKTAKQMYRVCISNTNFIDVTEDHSLIGYRNTNVWKPGETRLINVKPEEIGIIANSLIFLKRIPRININDLNYTKEIYQIMGYVLGDGYVAKTVQGNIGLSIGNQDKEEVIEKLLLPLIKQKWITSFKEQSNTHDVRICGSKLYYLLRSTLYETGIKRIPKFIFQETEEHIGYFLSGYFSADGSTSIKGKVSLCSITYENIIGVQQLLFYCGIPSNYFQETTPNLYKNISTGTYSYHLNIKDGYGFREKIGFILTRKQNCIIKKRGNATKMVLDYGISLCRITKIEKLEYDDYVYDIEVEDTHTFFANNILVHNTDSCYYKTYTQNSEEAIKTADAVAEVVNKSFPAFMREAFLCQPGYDQKIKTAREIVSDRGIFVDKKRYMLHIIDSEGHAVDKLKIMGLELKKTTLPKPVQQTLTKFIERLLKGATWDSIAAEVVAYKKELINTQDILSIGLPKGVNNVENYTVSYERDRTCRLPGHVAAAIYYNIQLKEHEDHESPVITSGTKLKVFYLKSKFGKFKSIALPTDIDTVPSWFYEYFLPILDRDAQLYRLVDKPLEHILNAINEEVPTAQLFHVKELFTF